MVSGLGFRVHMRSLLLGFPVEYESLRLYDQTWYIRVAFWSVGLPRIKLNGSHLS